MSGESQFDTGRRLEGKAVYSGCYAPTTSMYFDQFGKVRACCQNTTTVLGDVTRGSIREIWESADAARLRSALEVRDLSLGCGFCRWQLEQKSPGRMFSRTFDRLPVSVSRPKWPVQMEFAMSNACNLQCVMCNGDWSSAIRSKREGRPPLPVIYRDAFFEELAEFLPHLEQANFLGGEPFLGGEALRVMGMIAERHLDLWVSVTTNGTQWSPRIEKICRRLRLSYCVSLDGVTKTTFEKIRVGADHDAVLRNLDRFRKLASANGGSVSIAHCLMRTNWFEFLELLTFAEERDLDVVVNTVTDPASQSLYTLDRGDLERVVSALSARDSEALGRLDRLRPVWKNQLSALTRHLQDLDLGAGPVGDDSTPWRQNLQGAGRIDHDDGLREMLRTRGRGEPLVLRWDADGVIVEVDPRFVELLDEPSAMIGLAADELSERFAERYGPQVRRSPVPGWKDTYDVEFVAPDGRIELHLRFAVGRVGDSTGVLAAHRT